MRRNQTFQEGILALFEGEPLLGPLVQSKDPLPIGDRAGRTGGRPTAFEHKFLEKEVQKAM